VAGKLSLSLYIDLRLTHVIPASSHPCVLPWMISLTVRYGGTVVTADTWSETAAIVLIHR